MHILKARDTGNGYEFRVHLDDSKEIEVTPAVTDDEGNVIEPAVMGPDPAWCVEYTWGKEDMTLTAIKREMKLLCALELEKRQVATGTALAMEGQAL